MCRVLAVAAFCLMATMAQAQRPGGSAEEPFRFGGNAGEFDYFLLSLSLAPSFCALSPANRSKQECRSLTEADFQETPLTVHGLWPNRARVSVNRQPQDCMGSPYVAPSENLQVALRRYMPGGPGLARYEWRKHGTCSGLSPEKYFTTVVRLAKQANDTIGAVMRSNAMLGHSILIEDLLAAVGRADPALASAIIVDCHQPRGGGDALVDEIRVTLSKDFRPIRTISVGLGQNSGCPGGRGLVPDVPR